MKKYSEVIGIGWSCWQSYRYRSGPMMTLMPNYRWRKVILRSFSPKKYIATDIAAIYLSIVGIL